MVTVTQSELASLRVAAAATEEERARAEREVERAKETITWLEQAKKDLRADLAGTRDAYGASYEEWESAPDRLWTERSVYKGALKELEELAPDVP